MLRVRQHTNGAAIGQLAPYGLEMDCGNGCRCLRRNDRDPSCCPTDCAPASSYFKLLGGVAVLTVGGILLSKYIARRQAISEAIKELDIEFPGGVTKAEVESARLELEKELATPRQ